MFYNEFSTFFKNTSFYITFYTFFETKHVFSKNISFYNELCSLFQKNSSFYNELYTVRLGAILRPFWHRAGPMAEQSRAEPSRAEPSRAGPSRAKPSRAEPGRPEPNRAEPSRTEPSRAEPEATRTSYCAKTSVFTMNSAFLYPLQKHPFLQ